MIPDSGIMLWLVKCLHVDKFTVLLTVSCSFNVTILLIRKRFLKTRILSNQYKFLCKTFRLSLGSKKRKNYACDWLQKEKLSIQNIKLLLYSPVINYGHIYKAIHLCTDVQKAQRYNHAPTKSVIKPPNQWIYTPISKKVVDLIRSKIFVRRLSVRPHRFKNFRQPCICLTASVQKFSSTVHRSAVPFRTAWLSASHPFAVRSLAVRSVLRNVFA